MNIVDPVTGAISDTLVLDTAANPLIDGFIITFTSDSEVAALPRLPTRTADVIESDLIQLVAQITWEDPGTNQTFD